MRAIHWNWDERKGLKARLCYSSYPEISWNIAFGYHINGETRNVPTLHAQWKKSWNYIYKWWIFRCYATLLLREKRSFQNAQMPWILPIDVPMIAVPHGAPKVFPKGETSDVSENEGTQKASRNASKCILSLKKRYGIEMKWGYLYLILRHA